MNRHFHARLGRALAGLVIALSTVGIPTFADETNCVPPPSGLVSWWAAEGNGSDSTGGNHATFYNGSYAAGKVGVGFAFNGSNTYASCAASTSLNLGAGQGFTFECWIKPEDLSKGQALAEWNDAMGRLGVQLWISIAEYGGLGSIFANLVNTSGVDNYFASAPNVLNLNSFQHVALTYDTGSGAARLFCNGVIVASHNVGMITPQTSYGLFLGSRVSGPAGVGSHFRGTLDEVALFNRALSAAEIQAIYVAGSAGKCSGPVPPFIASQPANQTAVQGDSVTFTVVAGGTSPLSYQWSLGGTSLDNATSSSLTLVDVQFGQAGNYTVQVTNAYGMILSSNATLEVNPPPPCVAPPVGLVSWWRGEGDGADALGGNTGVLRGGVMFGGGKVGQAFVFNGTDAAVEVGNQPNLNVGSGAGLTIEAWIKPANTTTPMPVMEWNSGSGGNPYGVHLWTSVDSPGSLFANLVDTSGNYHAVQSAAGVLTPDTFQHVALSYDKVTGMGKLYLNGQVSAQANLGTFTPRTSSSCYLGLRPAGGAVYRYAGIVDEVALYSRALSDAEVQAVYSAGGAGKCTTPSAPSVFAQPAALTIIAGEAASFSVIAGGTPPLSYQWNFNGADIQGATTALLALTNVQIAQAGNYAVLVTNAAGSMLSSNAVLTVNPPPPCVAVSSNIVSWWRGEANTWDHLGVNNGDLAGDAAFGAGRVSQAFVFDGSGDAIPVGNQVSLQLQNLSIEGWIKRASSSVVSYGAAGNGVIFGYGIGGYGLYMDASGRLNFTRMGSTTVTLNTPRITDTAFHHVAVTKSGNTVMFFVDGMAYASPDFSATFVFSTGAAIGARGDTFGNSFYGTIDELALYNRALTADEIRAIHTAGVSGKCAVAVAPYFLAQPASQTNTVGSNVTFTASAGGTQPLAYQWRFNQTAIEGATTASLTLSNVQFNQAGNYSVVVTNDGGSLTSSNAVLAVNHPPAGVWIGSTNAASGGTVVVPVVLAANGNENALGFSLSFNPAHLTFVEVTLGNGGVDGSLFFNSSQATAGKLGVAVGLAPDAVFAAGTQEVARVRFTTAILSEATPTSIAFSDQPIQRLLSGVSGNVLPANYASGTVAIAAVNYEGDVTPRPNGDRALTVSDWVVMGRYVARLDYPTNAVEFQRADCAPRATLGDGSLKVTDWVQAGRYMAALDPLTPLGGPAGEGSSAPRFAPPPQNGSPERQLRGTDLTLAQGQVGTLAVALEAQGDEAGVSFTLSFDPAALSYVGATIGSGASGASLYVNSNEAAQGKLGVALALPSGTFAAGTKEVVRINLRAAATAAGSQSVAFSDQPVPRDVSGVMANSLATAYVASNVVIHPLPALRITAADQHIQLAWPGWATNCILEAASGTIPSSGGWTNLGAAPIVAGEECTVTLPRDSDAKFYRLRLP